MRKLSYLFSILIIIILIFCCNSNGYESRSHIQEIIGVKIPEFDVINSQNESNNALFDSESNTKTTIEFRSLPDDKLFLLLDSICKLPFPEKVDVNSIFFYISLESSSRCWSKKGDKYYYGRNTDFGEKFLRSKDSYFYFRITKGSKTAEIEYGNY